MKFIKPIIALIIVAGLAFWMFSTLLREKLVRAEVERRLASREMDWSNLSQKTKDSSEKINMLQIVLSVFGLLTSFYIFAYTDDVIELASKIDISFSSVRAADGEKNSSVQKKKEEKNANQQRSGNCTNPGKS